MSRSIDGVPCHIVFEDGTRVPGRANLSENVVEMGVSRVRGYADITVYAEGPATLVDQAWERMAQRGSK